MTAAGCGVALVRTMARHTMFVAMGTNAEMIAKAFICAHTGGMRQETRD
jgi:hypothetical protein